MMFSHVAAIELVIHNAFIVLFGNLTVKLKLQVRNLISPGEIKLLLPAISLQEIFEEETC